MARCIILAIIAAAAAPWAAALELGDPAPGLRIQEWVKGEPVESFLDGQVYIVEFWATWCAPCEASIPHLTEMQQEYAEKGLTIIGISDEDASTVHPFVAEKGGGMGYTVALDDNSATARAYMGAFGIQTLPHAFIVDQSGNLVWEGNPLADDLEGVVSQVLAGTFDFKEEAEAEERALRAGALTKVLAFLAREAPEGDLMEAVAQRAMDYAASDATTLAEIAYLPLAADDVPDAIVPIAKKAAQKAYDLSEGNNPHARIAMARIEELQGNLDEALRHYMAAQQSAVDPQMRDFLEQRVEALQASVSVP